jgi:hypothetical protein
LAIESLKKHLILALLISNFSFLAIHIYVYPAKQKGYLEVVNFLVENFRYFAKNIPKKSPQLPTI